MVSKNPKSDRLIYQAMQFNQVEINQLEQFKKYIAKNSLPLPPYQRLVDSRNSRSYDISTPSNTIRKKLIML
jgi:hypothetical protein